MHKIGVFGIALFLIISVLYAILYAQEAQIPKSPHHGGSQCRNCHLANTPDAANTMRTTLVNDVDLLCKSCHDTKEGLSHPSGMKMNWPPPDNLPLDWAGRLTCTTCHYMHLEGKEDKTGYMLRTQTVGREFCELCHSEFQDQEGGKHRRFLDKSHLVAPDSSTSDLAALDHLSQECLACHVGRIEQSYSRDRQRKITTFQHGQIQSTHPIAVPYPPLRSGDLRFNSVLDLDKRIHLYRGKIGCGTCHEPFSARKSSLVMENDEDELCLQCHLMNRKRHVPSKREERYP
jgi:predicted CXXCH cytochrome family protein